MTFIPVLHAERCKPMGVSFSETHIIVDLADGRALGVPLRFFPLLEAASDRARENFDLLGDAIYWDDVDDGIDLSALLTGLYIEPGKSYMDGLRNEIASREPARA